MDDKVKNRKYTFKSYPLSLFKENDLFNIKFNKKIGIYFIKNIVTNEYYVGQSRNMKSRIKDHICKLDNNKHIYKNGDYSILQKAWNKYGKNNFIYDYLEWCNFDNLNEREKYWIDKLQCNRIKTGRGYNLNDGGSGQKYSKNNYKQKRHTINNGVIQKCVSEDELQYYIDKGFNLGILEKTRQKIINNRKILFGVDHPIYGKKWSKTHRENAEIGIRKAQLQGKYKWKRTKQSEETKEKRINTLKNKKINDNSLKALNEIAKKNRKPVVQLSLDNEFIARYESMSEASNNTNVSASVICECCKNRKESAKGYRWLYEEEYEKIH